MRDKCCCTKTGTRPCKHDWPPRLLGPTEFWVVVVLVAFVVALMI